jgi:hypothetical protein
LEAKDNSTLQTCNRRSRLGLSTKLLAELNRQLDALAFVMQFVAMAMNRTRAGSC